MAELRIDVQVAAGSLQPAAEDFLLDHGWADGGVAVDSEATGAHLLLVSVGLCVLNDVYREAQPGLLVEGVRVRVFGHLDAESWSSASISYEVEVDSPEDEETVATLLERVDAVAEVPRVLRGEVTVSRR